MGVSAVCITINTSYALDSAVVGNVNVAKRLPTFKADVEPVTDGRMEYILMVIIQMPMKPENLSRSYQPLILVSPGRVMNVVMSFLARKVAVDHAIDGVVVSARVDGNLVWVQMQVMMVSTGRKIGNVVERQYLPRRPDVGNAMAGVEAREWQQRNHHQN